MKELTLREIQLGELGVLKKLKEICEDQGLRYFLFFGTLLGAIRHKGFIPWDDDVDVGMPREDYEKLLGYFRENSDALLPFRLMHFSTNENYIYPIARICDTRYQVDYSETKEYGLGLFIDIYPFDGWGDTEEDGERIYRQAAADRSKVFLSGLEHFVPSHSAAWRTPIKWVAYQIAKLHPANFYAKKLDNFAKRTPYENSRYVGCTNWADSPRQRVDKTLLETISWRFEDEDFAIPVGYDAILRKEYGDYMQLPPEEDRVGHHYYKAYRKDS